MVVNSRIARAFMAQEKMLVAALEYARAVYEHKGNRGSSVEAAFREFLDRHTPRNLGIGTGEVIDSYGNRSGQVDVVITNEDQPLMSPVHEPGLFLVEGVSCAGEVKSLLNVGQLVRAINAGRQFKTLNNVVNPGDAAYTNPIDLQRFHGCPPFFVFAMESDINEGTLLSRLHQASVAANIRCAMPLLPSDSSASHVVIPPVDGVFILGKGSAITFTEGSSLALGGPDEMIDDWAFLRGEEGVVIHFLMWLHTCMPRFRRAVSIAPNYFEIENGKFNTLADWNDANPGASPNA